MKFKLILFFYVFLLLLLSIFSYAFVDPNLELNSSSSYQAFQKRLSFLVFQKPIGASLIFIFFVLSLFFLYLYLLNSSELSEKQLWRLILVAVLALFLSYPAFSHDIFNYIMVAKIVTLYHENPYFVMPIEFLGEPMLAFMHFANAITPYPPFWIILTLIPSILAKGNILAGIFLFKLLIVFFYLGSAFLIGKMNHRGLVFFAFNPLVLIEVLISSHNDMVMMFFALLGFYLLFRQRKTLSLISLLVSAGIKYVTIILLPLFLLLPRLRKERLISFSCWLLFSAFLLSPLKRELYPWYLIWVLPLVALETDNKMFFWLTIAFSFGLLGRYLPFLYTGSWGGITPMVKIWVTIIPPVAVILIFSLKQIFFRIRLLRR